MPFFAGVDGGATKTLAVIGDEHGNILGRGRSGPGNYQLIGLEAAMKAVGEAIDLACAQARRTRADLTYAALGLAGADRPVDFEELDKGARGVLGGTPFRVLNDTWVGLRGGTRAGWGAVAVSGSGANAAARSRDGRQAVLHAMGYETGNRGGAADIVRDAMHWAFRSLERSGPKSLLEAEVPKLMGYKDLDELMSSAYSYEDLMRIAPLVFKLASQGDQAAQDILVSIGTDQGDQVCGVIRQLGLEDEPVEVVLVGSVYKGEDPLLIDAMNLAIHRVCPRARLHPPVYQPAVGAYLTALEDRGVVVDQRVYANVDRTAGDLKGAVTTD